MVSCFYLFITQLSYIIQAIYKTLELVTR